ncbi:MAG: cytochrome c-type biogenesis protein [Burkholderiales bacterium]
MNSTAVKTLALALLLLTSGIASAREAAPAAEDPVLERRVIAVTSELRCLVCQNQTIADSNAGLAIDLKNEVREKMKQGMSDREIVDFMVARYGDFVLYRPPFKATTTLLWLGPLLLLAAGLLALFYRLTRRRAAGNELDEAQRARAVQLLASESETDKS